MSKADPHAAFAAHVRKASGKVSSEPIVAALGKLVAARLRRLSAHPLSPLKQELVRQGLLEQRADGTVFPIKGKLKQRRSPRRLGRNRSYTPTDKVDTSRLGTFRHYMIATIRAHNNTRIAEMAHADCDNPRYSKNRLDFNWAADNGFINWD